MKRVLLLATPLALAFDCLRISRHANHRFRADPGVRGGYRRHDDRLDPGRHSNSYAGASYARA